MNKTDFTIFSFCTAGGKGGVESYFIDSVSYLSSKNIKLIVGCKKNTYIDSFVSNKEKYYFSSNKLSFLINFFKLLKFLHIKNLIIQINESKDLLVFVFIKKIKPSLKIIYTRHFCIGNKNDFFHNFLYRNIDLLLVSTENMRQQALSGLSIRPNNVVRLFLGTKFRKTNKNFQLKIKISSASDSLILGCFSRIHAPKGQHLILEAIRDLGQIKANIKLVLVGHIDDEKYYNSLFELAKSFGFENNIHYLGFQREPNIIMQELDCLIMPSYHETFGLVLIEAMALNIPVIASNSGGVPEIIQHKESGLLFTTKDSSSLADNIKLLYEDQGLRKKLAQNGKARVEEHFCQDKHFDKFIELAKNLAFNTKS